MGNKFESFDTNVYARTSSNNMLMITASASLSEEEQKQVEDIFATAL